MSMIISTILLVFGVFEANEDVKNFVLPLFVSRTLHLLYNISNIFYFIFNKKQSLSLNFFCEIRKKYSTFTSFILNTHIKISKFITLYSAYFHLSGLQL